MCLLSIIECSAQFELIAKPDFCIFVANKALWSQMTENPDIHTIKIKLAAGVRSILDWRSGETEIPLTERLILAMQQQLLFSE